MGDKKVEKTSDFNSERKRTHIPLRTLFGNPDKTKPLISPDGKSLSFLGKYKNNALNIWLEPIEENPSKPVLLTKDLNRGILGHFWSFDNEHILFLKDENGSENNNLYSVNIYTKEIKNLTPFNNVKVLIIDQFKFHPNKILVALNLNNPDIHDVYCLDVHTCELNCLEKNPGNISVWYSDSDLNIRGVIRGGRSDGGTEVLLRRHPGSKWIPLRNWGLEGRLLNFNRKGDVVYIIDSLNSDACRLVKLNLITNQVDILSEQYEFRDYILQTDSLEIQAISFMRDTRQWVTFDERLSQLFMKIQDIHKGDFVIYNQDENERYWLIGFYSDLYSTTYYRFDRRSLKAKLLFHERPELNECELAEMKPISFATRDGVIIHGYATFPRGHRRNLPTVIKVHGGPWTRDYWGFDAEAQWLANRGYLCLQINFRGSNGYGKLFMNLGNKEWGGKMNDDLIDAVFWAIEQGYTDPKKVAIYGSSYGGYAALAGAAFTPDIFSCAVIINGPSNLISLIKSIPSYWKATIATWYKRVGNPITERDLLISRSPLFKVKNIKIPLLIVQGANDSRVKKEESEQIINELRNNKTEYTYLLFEDEGHILTKVNNKMRFYAICENFLANHLRNKK